MVVVSLLATTRRADAEVLDLHRLELAADLFADDRAAGQDGDVAQHLLASIAEAWSLDPEHVDDAAQLVHDQRGQGLASDVLRDDEQVLLAGGDDLLERRDDVRDGADLLVGDEDVRFVEHRLHAIGIGHEVGADVAPVELHAFHEFDLEGHGAALLDRDDTVLAGLVEDVRDEVADLLVGSADGGHLGNLLVRLDLDGRCHEVFDNGVDALCQARA